MRAIPGKLFPPVAALLLAGCATGFDRGAIRERLAGERVEVDDAEIAKALALRPQIRLPIKVAVFLNAEALDRPGRAARPEAGVPGWRWTVRDEEAIAAWAEPLRT